MATAFIRAVATMHSPLDLALCRFRGIEFDWDVHANDVLFYGPTGEIYILGSLNEEEREAVKFLNDSLEVLHMAAQQGPNVFGKTPGSTGKGLVGLPYRSD